MPKKPTLEQRMNWHKKHAKNCGCRPIPQILLSEINANKPINPYFLGAQFLKYCMKRGWLRQDGSGSRGTKWFATVEGKENLKGKFNIEI